MESQRSTENLQEIEIYPATENWKQMETESFLAYFPVKETILFLDEPVRLQESAEIVEKAWRAEKKQVSRQMRFRFRWNRQIIRLER